MNFSYYSNLPELQLKPYGRALEIVFKFVWFLNWFLYIILVNSILFDTLLGCHSWPIMVYYTI